MHVHSATSILFTALNDRIRTSQFLGSEADSHSESLSQAAGEQKIKRKALVVDDVFDVTEMLSVLLTYAGYTVVTAASAKAALAAAGSQQFDVVISDIGMPEMNGYELARALRALPGYATIPLVAVTGYSMFDDRQRSLSSGFNAHMTKPIDPTALLDLIDKL